MDRESRTQVSGLLGPTILVVMYAWAASYTRGLHPRRTPTAKVARTDVIAAAADDTYENSSCGATPEAV